MITEDLRRLADRAEGVEGRQPDRLTELHGRIRAARQRRAAVGAAAAAGVAIALVVGGVAITGSTDKTNEPVDQNTPKPTPTETAEVPAGQQTVTPDIGPGDIRGWELRGSRTNTQPGFEAATDLSLTVQTGGLYAEQSYVAPFCNGDPGTWWVLTMDLGGVDGERNDDGSMQDGTRGMFGTCSQDDPTAVPPATGTIGPWQWDQVAMAYPLRMFVTDALSVAAQQCLSRTTDTDSCLTTHGLVPVQETDATFGFGVYEHLEAPTVMTIPGARFQALAIADGVEYLVDQAVVSAKGASRLVVQLPESDRSRIVAVYQAETAALEDCAAELGHGVPSNAEEERAQQEEFQRRCAWKLQLRIDGQLPPDEDYDFSFAEQQVVLPPGDARQVTVEVVKNDPRNVRYAVVIWEARS